MDALPIRQIRKNLGDRLPTSFTKRNEKYHSSIVKMIFYILILERQGTFIKLFNNYQQEFKKT